MPVSGDLVNAFLSFFLQLKVFIVFKKENTPTIKIVSKGERLCFLGSLEMDKMAPRRQMDTRFNPLSHNAAQGWK